VDDIIAVTGRENAIGSTLSVLSVVFTSWSQHLSVLISDFQLIRCVAKVVEAVYPRLTCRPIVPLTPRRRTLSLTDVTPPSSSSQSQSADEQIIPENSVAQASKEQVDTENIVAQGGPESMMLYQGNQQGDTKKTLLQVKNNDNVEEKTSMHLTGPQVGTENKTLAKSEWDNTENINCSKSTVKSEEYSETDPSEVDGSVKMVEMLFEVLQNFLVDLLPILDSLPWQCSEEDKVKCDWLEGGGGSDEVTVAVPKSLLYLNTLCDRRRLECLIHTLDSVSHQHLVKKLHSIAHKHSLSRLSRIIEETLH
jgi:hypothetical protein